MRNFLFGILVGAIVGVYGYMTYTAPEPVYYNEKVYVSEYDTLWEIAGRYSKPEEDIRDVINRIRKVNGLGQHIYPGTYIVVPVLQEQ